MTVAFLVLVHVCLAVSADVAPVTSVQVTRFRFDPILEGEPQLPIELTARDTLAPSLRLLQLDGGISDDRLSDLQGAGIELLQYYPHDSYLVWSDRARLHAAVALGFVRWSGLFHPGYKIGPDLLGRQGRVENVSVLFYDDGAKEATVDRLQRLGAEILLHHPAQPDGALRTVVATLDAAAVDAVARIPTVVWLGYRSPQLHLDDEMSDQIVAGNHPEGVPVVGYESHLDSLAVSGSGVNWAIADTGVDFDHPELGSRIVHGWSGTGACLPAGSDCAGGGHGTHVAGIAGADGSTGVIDPNGFLCGLGVAPAFNIVALNVFFGSDPLQEYSKQAVLGGAIGSNNSWTTGEGTCHGYQDSERTFDFIARDGNWEAPGAEPQIVVFSAGNSGPGSCTLTAPKEAKNVVVTGGTQNFRTTGDIDAMQNLSSRGPTADGRLGPTIVAPGQTIYSTKNDLGGLCSNPSGCSSSLHSVCSGTSMAAPHASGSIVLLAEWWRSLNDGADPSPAMVKALLVNTAVDIGSVGPIPNTHEGWGRINFTRRIDAATAAWFSDQQHTFDESGEEFTVPVSVVDAGQPLKITLAWSDAPGAVGANPALVNDLDLEVAHGGDTYSGNVFTNGWSTPGGVADPLNNLENVYLESPTADSAVVRIRARAINGDGVPFSGDITDQDFALVCSNCELGLIFADGFESGDTSAWGETVP